MINLLKTDLRRSIRDKLFLILCIIGLVFALLTPVLYKVLFAVLEIDEVVLEELAMMGLGATAKSMFFSSFSLGNNFGIILPTLTVIILCKDFGQGTIRNKIICGKSRTSIYFSLFTTCVILVCSCILASALLTMLFSLIFFKYQVDPFTLNDFWYLLLSIGLEMMLYLLVCAILTFFVVYMKNAGLAIVMYFATYFLMTIIGSVTQAAIILLQPHEVGYSILEFLNIANPFTTTVIGTGENYTLQELIYLIVPNILFTVGIVFAGLFAFKKKELK